MAEGEGEDDQLLAHGEFRAQRCALFFDTEVLLKILCLYS